MFLGLSVWGDFSIELKVSAMDALPGHSVGLMVRVPTADGLDHQLYFHANGMTTAVRTSDGVKVVGPLLITATNHSSLVNPTRVEPRSASASESVGGVEIALTCQSPAVDDAVIGQR